MQSSTRPVGPFLALLFAAWLHGSALAGPTRTPDALVVALHTDGEAAVLDCAHRRFAQRRPLRDATADRSDSLDRLWGALPPASVTPLFRAASDRPFPAQRAALAARLEQTATRRARSRPTSAALPELAHIYRIRFASSVDLDEALARHRADPHVAWAQIDHFVVPDDHAPPVPNDPFFASAGAWGQPEADLWGLDAIGAPAVWGTTQGEGIVVAVVDSGLDYDHPDIAANVHVHPGEDLDGDGRIDASERNGIDDDGNGFVDDLRGFDFANSVDENEDGDFDDAGDVSDAEARDAIGHGTHLAGTIAAIANNGIGIVGVAPKSRILPVQIFAPEVPTPASRVWRAVLYAAENGADVVNLSSSCGGRCPSNPLAVETVRAVHALGVILVTSSGNREDDVVHFQPEGQRELLTVGAINPRGEVSGFSNFGFEVDVLGPGGGPVSNVLSLRSSVHEGDGLFVAPGYERRRGTSMATASVSGAVALLLAADPTLDFEAVRARLRTSARDLGPVGHDRRSAAGVLDVPAALAARPPDLRGRIDAPLSGATLATSLGAVEVHGTATGEGLAHWTLSVGDGPDPDTWIDLAAARSDAVEDGLLARWPVADASSGIRVLRLRLAALDGSTTDEFSVLSLERIVPIARSSESRESRQPTVDGDRVLWRQRARENGERVFRIQGIDLTDDAALSLTDPPVNPVEPQIVGDLVVWQDLGIRGDDPASKAAELTVCRLSAGDTGCTAAPLATGAHPRSAPRVGDDWIVWSSADDERWQLFGCRIDELATGCTPRALLDHETSTQFEPDLAGERLVWLDSRAGTRLELHTCRLGPTRSSCVPARVRTGTSGQTDPVASGDLVVFEEFVGLQSALHLCALDPDDPDAPCDRTLIALGEELHAAVDGDHVVWQQSTATESDIWFCRYDRVRRECPAQRLTGSVARQQRPDVDGARIVFEDERAGVGVIREIVVPTVTAPERVAVAAGGLATISVRATAPEADATLEVMPDGGALPGATWSVERSGPPRDLEAVWRWRPEPAHAGEHEVRFRVRDASGLFATATTRIAVPEPGEAALPIALLVVLALRATVRRAGGT